MVSIDFPVASWLILAVQSLGIISAITARIPRLHSHQSTCQSVFLVCLLLVGVASAVSLRMGTGHWLFSGATLAVMAVAATLDLE